MLINTPVFDVKSKELALGSALWVESEEDKFNKHSMRGRDDFRDVHKVPAIIISTTPLCLKVHYFDPSTHSIEVLTIDISKVTSRFYTLTPMIPEKNISLDKYAF